MLKFKQFLILEQDDPTKAIQDEIDSLLQKMKDPNITNEEKMEYARQIGNKKNELANVKDTAETSNMTAAPKAATAGVDVEGPPSTTAKQSAFDAVQTGKMNQTVGSMLSTPGRDNMVRSLESETPGTQGLATDKLGNFSKSFYRL